jgi:hypothetical protein
MTRYFRKKSAVFRALVHGPPMVEGIACPRCGMTTEVREHTAVTVKMQRQPFYYRRWFYCMNTECKTTTIMRDEDRVPTKDDVAPEQQDDLLDAIMEQLRPRG